MPPPLELRDMDHDELILLAHLLGNGAVTTDTDIEYRSASASNPSAVSEAARRRFAVAVGRADNRRHSVLHLSPPVDGGADPIREWRDQTMHRGSEAAVPAAVFQRPEATGHGFPAASVGGGGTISRHRPALAVRFTS